MDSNQDYQLQQQQQNQQPSSSGLLRFRSAPSSFLSNLTPSVINNERLVNRFASYGAADSNSNSISISNNDSSAASPSFQDFKENKPFSKGMNSQQQGYGGGGGGLPPHYPRHGSSSAAMDGYLLRQGSSPASLFSNGVSFQNGFGTMKCVGNYGAVNGNNGQISPSIDRLKSQISFSSRSASSLGMLSQISEIEGEEDIGATSPDDGRQGGSNGHGFPYVSWNDTPQLSGNFSGLKRGRSGNERMFSELQNGELGSHVHTLTHHLSLPKTSAEMAAMDKLLQSPDSVPCKIRAKRGCATHPRSIAERVRRTRISERMRKLQDLVPNMDKQTNTSDMLDLAVDYIKDLQKQFKTLSEKRAKCKCMSTQKAETNPID